MMMSFEQNVALPDMVLVHHYIYLLQRPFYDRASLQPSRHPLWIVLYMAPDTYSVSPIRALLLLLYRRLTNQVRCDDPESFL